MALRLSSGQAEQGATIASAVEGFLDELPDRSREQLDGVLEAWQSNDRGTLRGLLSEDQARRLDELGPQLSRAAETARGGGALGTDIALDALELAHATADAANVEFPVFVGSVLDAVPADRTADLITANLPHKPCPRDRVLQVSQNGGPQGDKHHALLAAQAAERLAPGARVVFFMHSLPHPRLLGHYAEAFDLTLLAWKYRFLAAGEYGALEDHFVERCRMGDSFMYERDGKRALIGCAWMARRK